MNSLIGSTGLAIALASAVATIGVGFIAAKARSNRLTDLSRHGVYLTTAAIFIAAFALTNAFVTHDYSIKYVQHYSDNKMPMLYLLSAFWGGQEGSLLFWATVLAASSSIAITTARRKVPDLMPWVHVILMSVILFFLLLLVFLSDPFETFYLMTPPSDGGGLNPILQNYWMAIHPPTLLIGYAVFAVPFSFGAAAMLRGRFDVSWIKVTRRWLLISWMFLSLGCILGGRWAYEELGWGGYWAWDPVENAAILPWFTATALLHSVIIQERRGMLKRWNFSLLVLTFWLTIFGTFLTRSGMIASVHTFAASSIGPAFLVYVFAVAGGGIMLLVWRWKKMTSDQVLESVVNREAVFILNNWLMLALMFVVLWGTIGPKFSDLLSGEDTALGAAWFNKFVIPITIVVLFFMGVGTLIAWRKASIRNFRRNFMVPVLVSCAITPLLWWLYSFRLAGLQPEVRAGDVWMAKTTLALSVFGVVIIGFEFWRGIRSRRRKTGSGFVAAFFSLMSKHRRRYGGYLVHLGFILICFGIAGNAFKVSQEATLRDGESVPLGDYVVTFHGMVDERHDDKDAIYATLTMKRCERIGSELDLNNCGEEQTIRPSRFDYTRTRFAPGGDSMKHTTEIAINTNILEDVYITIAGWRTDSSGATLASFNMHVNPLTFWLWFGGLIVVASVIICMWPEPVPASEKLRAPPVWRLRADASAMLLVSLIPLLIFFAPALGSAQEEAEAQSELVVPVRSEGSEASAIYGSILCQCGTCGRKAVDQCQPGCQWGRQARSRIDRQVAEGLSRQEILDGFEEEYGVIAIAIPDKDGLVWVVPLLSISGGAFLAGLAVFALSRRKKHHESQDAKDTSDDGEESPEDAEYLSRLEDELRELD